MTKDLPSRSQTAREALYAALLGGSRTARELSAALSLRERDVLEHLTHLERTLASYGERLEVVAARCLACGYEFGDRTRLTKPGRCPQCRSTRIAVPTFCITRS